MFPSFMDGNLVGKRRFDERCQCRKLSHVVYGLCTGLLSYVSRKEVCGIDSWEYSTVLRVRVCPTCLGTKGLNVARTRTRGFYLVYCPTCIGSYNS
jgi:hypothetical protein